MTEHDWYAYLQLPPQASTRDVEQAVERLSRQASALAMTAPERSQQLRETIRAIKRDLLSGPESPRSYDAPRVRDLAPPPPPAATAIAPPPPAPATAPRRAPKHARPEPAAPMPPPAPAPMPPAPAPAAHTPMPPGPAPAQATPATTPPGPAPAPMSSGPAPIAPPGQGAGSRLARFLRTGWTCPACGKGALPSDKFCTGCGSPIRLIRPEAASGPERAPSPRPFCPSCANPLGAMDVFCSKCGARR